MTRSRPTLDRLPTLLGDAVDTAADRMVVPGYTRLGFALRQRRWSPDDPAPGALEGRVALVTGASSGIGEATAVGLARLGATVVMLVRNAERGEQAAERVRSQVPGARLAMAHCDVSDLDSVRRCAATVAEDWPAVDVLVHDAGVMPPSREVSPQGHELTLATHVLGPLLLTDLLRPLLAAAGRARVVFMSSGGMYTQGLRTDDIEYRAGGYRGASAYARTKRMQVALAPLLADRYAADGAAVYAVHPGWVDTPGVSSSLPGFHRLTRPLLRTPSEGADTTVWLAATEPAPPSGGFWHDRRPRPRHYLPSTRASDADVRELWRYCADATGLAGP